MPSPTKRATKKHCSKFESITNGRPMVARQTVDKVVLPPLAGEVAFSSLLENDGEVKKQAKTAKKHGFIYVFHLSVSRSYLATASSPTRGAKQGRFVYTLTGEHCSPAFLLSGIFGQSQFAPTFSSDFIPHPVGTPLAGVLCTAPNRKTGDSYLSDLGNAGYPPLFVGRTETCPLSYCSHIHSGQGDSSLSDSPRHCNFLIMRHQTENSPKPLKKCTSS